MKREIVTAFSRVLTAWRRHLIRLTAAVAVTVAVSSVLTYSMRRLLDFSPYLPYLLTLINYPLMVGLTRIFWRACLGGRPRLRHLFAYYTQPRALLAMAAIQLLSFANLLCIQPLAVRILWRFGAQKSPLPMLVSLVLPGLLLFITRFLVIVRPQAGLAQHARLYTAVWRRRWRPLLVFYAMYFVLDRALLLLLYLMWSGPLEPFDSLAFVVDPMLIIIRDLVLLSFAAAFASVILSVRCLHRPRRRGGCRQRRLQRPIPM